MKLYSYVCWLKVKNAMKMKYNRQHIFNKILYQNVMQIHFATIDTRDIKYTIKT